MSHLMLIACYIPSFLTIVKSVYIETNFYLYLNQICTTSQTNIVLTKFNNNSIIELYFNQINCNYYHFNTSRFDDHLYERNFNLFIEFNNEEELILMIKNIYSDILSVKTNIMLLFKSKNIKGITMKLFESFVELRCYLIRYENNLNLIEVSYIRPIINGCHLYNGILYSSDFNVKEMLTTKPSQCNLNGTVLRVATNEV